MVALTKHIHFSNNVSERKQNVVSNREKSDCISLNMDIPHGSVLDSLLFSIYINDLPVDDVTLNCEVSTYLVS